MEAATGEASLTGLASLVVMLADSVGVKHFGGEAYWKLFVEELRNFERGKF